MPARMTSQVMIVPDALQTLLDLPELSDRADPVPHEIIWNRVASRARACPAGAAPVREWDAAAQTVLTEQRHLSMTSWNAG